MPCLNKNPLRKNCEAHSDEVCLRHFRRRDAALLMQGKDDKAKRTEQSRRNAAVVRLPLDYWNADSSRVTAPMNQQ